jgi:hypothetical protein
VASSLQLFFNAIGASCVENNPNSTLKHIWSMRVQINSCAFICIKPFLLHRIQMFWRKFRHVKEVTCAFHSCSRGPPPVKFAFFAKVLHAQIHAVLPQDSVAMEKVENNFL